MTYFPKILSRQSSFYLLGWTPSTYDAHNVLQALMASPDDRGQGQFNLGGWRNPRVDELTRLVQSETDSTRRDALIREALDLHARDIGHIPLHQQRLAWGMKRNLEVVQLPDNTMPFKWVVAK